MKIIGVDQIYSALGVANMPIPGAVTRYSNSFKLELGAEFGLDFIAAVSAGAPDLKIELEQSYVKPTTEGSADINYVVPEGGITIVASLTAVTRQITSLAPVVAPYGRFKITGAAGNHASTTLNIKLTKTEKHG